MQLSIREDWSFGLPEACRTLPFEQVLLGLDHSTPHLEEVVFGLIVNECPKFAYRPT
jgi:hypothetical protein